MDLSPPEPELLSELRLEFGDYGKRAGQFLETAHAFLGLDERKFPSVGPVVAYCLREAMTSILESANIEPLNTWKNVSRKVVDARKRYIETINFPGEDSEAALANLLESITELEDFHSQTSWHEKRLIAVTIDRTGTEPLFSDTRPPVAEYKKLLVRLNSSLHGSRVDLQPKQLWYECMTMFRRLFMPPEIRRSQLRELARNASPTAEDVEAVCGLLVSPRDVSYFLKQVTSPDWLGALGSKGILNPPGVEGVKTDWWPAFSGVVHLAEDYPEEVVAWLDKMHSDHETRPESSFYIADAALNIGGSALDLVLEAVRRHPQHAGIVMCASMAVQKLDASDELLESFAEILLNKSSWSTVISAESLMEKLSGGVTEANALRRIQLLCYKLRSVAENDHRLHRFEGDPSRSVTDRDELATIEDQDHFDALLLCMVDIIERAWDWVPVGELLSLLGDLPTVLCRRLRTWILGHAPEVDPDLLVEEIEDALSSRRPTSDDLALIDRAVEKCEPSTYADRWQKALGPVPTVEQAVDAKATEAVPAEWERAKYWVSLLPGEVTGEWRTPCGILAAPQGLPSRESLESWPRDEVLVRQSPFSFEQLRLMDPDRAAEEVSRWRPDRDDWMPMTTPNMLARTLEDVVKDAPERWFVSPVQIVTKLYHPTYIRHYLQAAADVVSDHELPVEELIGVIKLVRRNPWETEPLCDDRYAYDSDWKSAEKAAVDLIEAMAKSDYTFDGRADDMWAILESEVMNCSHDEELWMGDTSSDTYSRAVNRRCTRALRVVLSLIANEFRSSETVRPEAVDLLGNSLRLTGPSGAEHRSILAPRIGFLRHVLPDWMEANRELFFGDQAPEGLGQKTIDLALQWGTPNPWLLENYQNEVHNAADRGVERALNHLLVAMLRGIPGYSVEDTVDFLRKSSKSSEPRGLMFQAAPVLSTILRNGKPEPHHLEIAAEFWRAMLKQKTGNTKQENVDALWGFGGFSKVETMDSELWTELTLETLKALRKRVVPRSSMTEDVKAYENTRQHMRSSFSYWATEGAASLSPSPARLEIMDMLVRNQNDTWTSGYVTEKAVDILSSAQDLRGTAEYQRLRNALLERNAIES